MVAVIGRAAKDVAAGTRRRATSGVFAAERLEHPRRLRRKVRKLSFNLAKNFDGSASVGPCIVVGELDPADIEVPDASQR